MLVITAGYFALFVWFQLKGTISQAGGEKGFCSSLIECSLWFLEAESDWVPFLLNILYFLHHSFLCDNNKTKSTSEIHFGAYNSQNYDLYRSNLQRGPSLHIPSSTLLFMSLRIHAITDQNISKTTMSVSTYICFSP